VSLRSIIISAERAGLKPWKHLCGNYSGLTEQKPYLAESRLDHFRASPSSFLRSALYGQL
jgi:hypothetical protein